MMIEVQGIIEQKPRNPFWPEAQVFITGKRRLFPFFASELNISPLTSPPQEVRLIVHDKTALVQNNHKTSLVKINFENFYILLILFLSRFSTADYPSFGLPGDPVRSTLCSACAQVFLTRSISGAPAT
jgi:hypothetical protein